MKKRLLWIGDACCASGFARATHNIVGHLHETYDMHVLGVNYHGDPQLKPDGTPLYPYTIWPAYAGGDQFGIGRMKSLFERIGPVACIIQTDPWNIPMYLRQVVEAPVIGAIAIDGKNIRGAEQLSGLAHAIFWTEFAQREAREGGYDGPSTVVPLGIDLTKYKPVEDRKAVRERFLGNVCRDRNLPRDVFIVGVVAKNQSRKRLDLAIRYFAEWVREKNIQDALLWLHVAPTSELTFDLQSLAKYYRVMGQCIFPDIHPVHGIREDVMSRVYSTFDVLLNTSLGEGWWFPGMEAMACGTPCIAPQWSGFAEWAAGAALFVPCMETEVNVGPNTIGGVMDREGCIHALDEMYRDVKKRREIGEKGRARVQEPQFRWQWIADQYARIVMDVLSRNVVNVSEEVTV